MNSLFKMTVGLATIAAIGIGSYQLGMAQSVDAIDSIKINIDNTVDGVIDNVAEENRQGVEELLTPLMELIETNLNKGSVPVSSNELQAAAGRLERKLSDFSLIPYQAQASPFVPPKDKVQFLCGESFSLAYLGQNSRSPLISRLKVNSNTATLSPGDIREFKHDDQRLTMTVLEYKKELNGPILKYECEN
jgi:hypothetical protein